MHYTETLSPVLPNDLEEATEIAQRCPSLKHGMVVEVRPIADACAALGVRGRPHVQRELANT